MTDIVAEVKEKKTEEIRKEAEAGMRCPVNKALYYIEEFLSGPMCGKCFPCEMGSYEMRIRLKNLASGIGTQEDIEAIKKISREMSEVSMCKKGKDTAKFIAEWASGDQFEAHTKGNCPDMECLAFAEFTIIPGKCIMCNRCKEACKYNAILGEKKMPFKGGYLPYEIRQNRCTKCGDCFRVCPVGAVGVRGLAIEKELTEK